MLVSVQVCALPSMFLTRTVCGGGSLGRPAVPVVLLARVCFTPIRQLCLDKHQALQSL
jgi:hypothetical protein